MTVEPPNKKAKTQTSTFGRSVVDYVSEDELKEALATVVPQGHADMDWMLPRNDPDCEQQDAEKEMKRLLNLKSFMLLDSKKEEEFDKLTQEAREVFGVPTSLISLIDLGRQFFVSKAGAEATETTRAASFCGYTILKKDGMLVVPDAKEDDRFKDGELVNSGSKTRFYAGAALVSPEGEKLGAFCVTSPESRAALTSDEEGQLKEYAQRTMDIMVERRKRLRDRLSADNVCKKLRVHAAVATSLGDILYLEEDLQTAMRLYQESVQTVMWVEENGQGAKPSDERQEAMRQLFVLLSQKGLPKETKKELLERVVNLYDKPDGPPPENNLEDGISGVFQVRPNSKKTDAGTYKRLLPELVFRDVFKIDMREVLQQSVDRPVELLDFTVPIEECAKATLFNMGQIQYHWQNQQTAMQFFHLAASVSHKLSPLYFDPIDISCLNNMAQIHFQYGQPDDALKMLKETLDRGNRTLAAMYRLSETELECDGGELPVSVTEQDADKTHRLRRKLARTLINIAHVLFSQGKYDEAMKSLKDGIPLLDTRTMTGKTRAAIHYDMSLVLHRQKKHADSLGHLDRFIEFAKDFLNSPEHLQIGDAMHQRAIVLFEMGKVKEAFEAIQKAVAIRTKHLGESSSCVGDSLAFKGKIMVANGMYSDSVSVLQKALDIEQVALGNGQIDLDAAQIMLDMGRAYHSMGDVSNALDTYTKVLTWAKAFFGTNHPFVARISAIHGSVMLEGGKPDETRTMSHRGNTISPNMATA